MSSIRAAPVFLGFFIMGFVDVVGISTNYAKIDFGLSDGVANLLPMMVFIWFALFSLPTGLLMNRWGRRKVVLLGLGITLAALAGPFFAYRYGVLLVCFAGIGIGNTILQVALNPLLANVVPAGRLTPALTAGQLIKSLASFLGPVAAGFAVSHAGNWRLIFPVFAGVTSISICWLGVTPLPEVQPSRRNSSWLDCFRVLKVPRVPLLFFGVVSIVGLDVGLNTTLPKFLMERCGLPLEKAGLATSLYFIARTIGSLFGVVLLSRIRGGRVFVGSVAAGVAGLAGILLLPGVPLIGAGIVLTGLGVANIFPVLFSAALRQAPERENEVSGLLIMGVSGGALLLPVMGLIADWKGQAVALSFLLVAWLYLLVIGMGLRKAEREG